MQLEPNQKRHWTLGVRVWILLWSELGWLTQRDALKPRCEHVWQQNSDHLSACAGSMGDGILFHRVPAKRWWCRPDSHDSIKLGNKRSRYGQVVAWQRLRRQSERDGCELLPVPTLRLAFIRGVVQADKSRHPWMWTRPLHLVLRNADKVHLRRL